MITFNKNVPEIFLYDTSSEIELIVSKDFFVLYKDKRVYYYQENEKIDIEDILSYISKNFGFKDIKVTNKSDIILKSNSRHSFFKPKKTHFFKAYLVYLFLICIVFYLYDNTKIEDNSFENRIKENKRLKKSMHFDYVSKSLIKISEESRKNDIHIISLEQKYSKVFLETYAYSKKSIYAFLEEFQKNKIEKIEYDEKKRRFKAYVSFRLSGK